MNGPRNITNKKFSSSFSSIKESNEEEIHIISAGPSCRNFPWQTIRGKDIMTINDSIFHLPLKVTYHVYNEPLEYEKERYWQMTRKYPLVHKFTTFNYNGWHQLILYNDKNLAFMLAINLAIDLGYKIAYLYGYDFDCIDGYIHWWDTEPEKNTKIIDKKMEIVKKQKIMFDEFKNKISDKIILNMVEIEG